MAAEGTEPAEQQAALRSSHLVLSTSYLLTSKQAEVVGMIERSEQDLEVEAFRTRYKSPSLNS